MDQIPTLTTILPSPVLPPPSISGSLADLDRLNRLAEPVAPENRSIGTTTLLVACDRMFLNVEVSAALSSRTDSGRKYLAVET